MLLIVIRSDQTEESYDVVPTTKLRGALRGNVWFFRLTSGGEIAMWDADVLDAKLGNVEFDVKLPDTSG